MFIIEKLATNASKLQKTIEAVANIESLVQPYDAWTYQTLVEMVEQDSMHMLIVYKREDKADTEKVIGYCLYQSLFEQAEILRIGTHPDYQRQGIASQIFAKLNAELMINQVESLLLEVRADNFAAIALYEQQGFAVIHTRKGYYQVPHQPAIDALIMQHTYVY
ncbi:ribosomal-protein-alanine N-acetyltransferase [Psychrobacter luti]|uniref:Ribosomal-protein-alanine N-acetyltransferase n=1 Tax=Psychrobacter luti TaxID=198481 RepID=A0A839TF02_9GAMM|nr:ribosomal protein S18-alanine N-acetyltransferase [Psychrobacter luti]MBB3107927.1 ribosomal-protein-alanine N-acetyltransferase [Psychrobacter luti]